MVSVRGIPSRHDGRADEIRKTVVELVARHGYDNVTVDRVVAASGVGRATVYRRWPTKAELVVDAVRGSISVLSRPDDTGALRTDLVSLLNEIADELQRSNALLVALLDAARRHPDVREIMTTQFREPGRAAGTIPLSRAIARGEIREGCPSLLVDEVAIPMLVHRVLWYEPVDGAVVEDVVDNVLLPLLAAWRPS